MNTDKDLSAKIKNKDGKSLIILSLLPILSVIIIVATSIIKDWDIVDLIKTGILTFILTSIIVFFIRMQLDILKIKYAKTIIFLSYIISILLIMIPNNPDLYSFWMIGGLLSAMLIDSKLGLLI
ncbi:MAG: hypothetical protein GX237_09590, partial [Clostridiales bacterium]|nr:hypothetical protein [Clostridiales bacterium]